MNTQNTTPTIDLHQVLLERIKILIPKEKKNAVNLGTLCALTGLKARVVKELITELRLEHPIVAKETDGGGYWYAESQKDIEEFVGMIKRRRDGYDRTVQVMQGHQVPVL